MKIELNNEIRDFFQRCLRNLDNAVINDFLDCEITNENEKEYIDRLVEIGHYEFNDPLNYPSLFISTIEFLENRYYKEIKLDDIDCDGFKYGTLKILGNRLFNYDSVIFDPNRELNDSLCLRALDQDYSAITLWQDDKIWMLNVPSESQTIDIFASKACGDVLTYGLGIGYFVFQALNNKKVKSVTVVEYNLEIIELFKRHILPQFQDKDKIKIIHGDAFQHFNKENIDKYDYVFVDIYRSNDDGLICMKKMLENFVPSFDKLDFWIETSCLEILPTLILFFFINNSNYQKIKINDDYLGYYKLIEHYFLRLNNTVNDVDDLKKYMYDAETLRVILSGK